MSLHFIISVSVCSKMAIRLLLLSLFVSLSVSFSPATEYLLNCGSDVESTVDNRRFVADASPSNVNLFSTKVSMAIQGEDLSPHVPQIYRTARIFAGPAKYEFNVGGESKGTHMVRLHFHRLNSSRIDMNKDALFHVTVNGHVVLTNFSGDSDSDFGSKVREFLIWVDVGEVVIRFIPSQDSKLAFVSAIEVISAPKDLIADTATSVFSDGTRDFNGLAQQALQVLYRINVGGRKVTPFNDTLWRTWLPDDEFLRIGDASEKAYFSGRIKYSPRGASREVCPDNVYNTARLVKRSKGPAPQVDMSWDFPVAAGYKYLIRLHFCDIASKSLGMLYFNIFINGNMAYNDFDISFSAGNVLASPYYIDFVVDDTAGYNNKDNRSSITLSVGPSNMTSAEEYEVDAILNGVEIMKMNNSMGSLDGYVSTEMILRSCPNRRNLGIFMAMVALMCIFMSFYIVSQRKKVRDEHGWTKLSIEDNPKSGKP